MNKSTAAVLFAIMSVLLVNGDLALPGGQLELHSRDMPSPDIQQATPTPLPAMTVYLESRDSSSFPWNELVLAFVAAISALGGVMLSQYYERRRERFRKRQEWRDKVLKPYLDYFHEFLLLGQNLQLLNELALDPKEESVIRSKVGIDQLALSMMMFRRPLKGEWAPFENEELRERLEELFRLCESWFVESDSSKRTEIHKKVGKKYREWLHAAERFLHEYY